MNINKDQDKKEHCYHLFMVVNKPELNLKTVSVLKLHVERCSGEMAAQQRGAG